MNALSYNISKYGLIALLSSSVVFHIFVISSIVPYEIVWGGKINSKEQMYPFELVSILINLLMLAIVLIKVEIFKAKANMKFINYAIWTIFAIFMLNTVGNIFSENSFEKAVFTPVTFIASLFSLRLVLKK